MAIVRPTGYLSYYGFSPEDAEAYLAHYGVKGMKWRQHLHRKLSDISDQYLTGRSARASMNNNIRQANEADDRAYAARRYADRASEQAGAHQHDAEQYRAAIRNPGNSRIQLRTGGNDTVVRLRGQASKVNERLSQSMDEHRNAARDNRAQSVEMRNRQRAYENQMHAARAKAASDRRRYEKSLAGKLNKLLGRNKTR